MSQAIASVVQCEDIRVITEQKNNIAETIRYIRETLKVNI